MTRLVGGPQTTQSDPNPWVSSSATIRRVTEEVPDVKTFEISIDDPDVAARYRWQPGQFNMLYLPGVGEVAISICGEDRRRGVIRHTIRRVGNVTDFLDEADPGTAIGFRGPFGSSWPVAELERTAPQHRDVIVLAGGIGVVPLKPWIEHLLDHPELTSDVSLLIGARTPSDLLFRREWPGWKERGAKLQVTVDRTVDGWSGHVGVVTLLLQRLAIPHPESTLLMMCGPEVMMRYVAIAALQRRIQPSNIWVSLERHMNCAVGLCGHCQLGPVFVCKEGPVFTYDRVASWLHVQGF